MKSRTIFPDVLWLFARTNTHERVTYYRPITLHDRSVVFTLTETLSSQSKGKIISFEMMEQLSQQLNGNVFKVVLCVDVVVVKFQAEGKNNLPRS